MLLAQNVKLFGVEEQEPGRLGIEVKMSEDHTIQVEKENVYLQTRKR